MPDTRPQWLLDGSTGADMIDVGDEQLFQQIAQTMQNRQQQGTWAPNGLIDADPTVAAMIRTPTAMTGTPDPANLPAGTPAPAAEGVNGQVSAPNTDPTGTADLTLPPADAAPQGGGSVAPSAFSPDATGGAATGEGASTPAPSPAAATATSTPDPAAASTPIELSIPLPDGQVFALDVDKAKYLMAVHTWITDQPQEVKDQWAQIEHGRARAVPVEEYAAFQAWKAGGSPGVTAGKPDLSHLDPDEQAYIARIETAAAANATPPAAPQPYDVRGEAQRAAEQSARQTVELTEVTSAIAAEYGLDPAQASYLQSVTARLGVVPSIAQAKRVVSETGTVIAEGNFKDIIREGYEAAMAIDPTLRAIRDNVIVQRNLAATSPAAQAAAAKRANASSLATAPSAAVPGRNVDPASMTVQQRHDAAVAFVAEQMQNGQ